MRGWLIFWVNTFFTVQFANKRFTSKSYGTPCMVFCTYIYFSSLSSQPIIRGLFPIICISYSKQTQKIPYLLSVRALPCIPIKPQRYMNYSKTTQFFNTREQSPHVGLMLFHKKCDNRLDIRADCIFFIFFPFPRRRLELGLYELSFYKLICFKTHFYVFLENKFQWMFISLKVQIC